MRQNSGPRRDWDAGGAHISGKNRVVKLWRQPSPAGSITQDIRFPCLLYPVSMPCQAADSDVLTYLILSRYFPGTYFPERAGPSSAAAGNKPKGSEQ
jgi:hypothetical protein